MKQLVILFSFLLLGGLITSCGQEKRKTATGGNKPKATPTPEASNDPASSDSEEVQKLKAQIAEMNNKSATADTDGWRLIPNEITFNNPVSIRVDFDDADLGKQMRLTLTECSGVKIVKPPVSLEETQVSNTVDGEVGGLVEILFYRANGEVTAPSSSCKLKADIVNRDNETVEKSDSKTITIKAGTARLSQSSYQRYFTNNNGWAYLSVMTHGISDGYTVNIYVFKEQSNEQGTYQLIGHAIVLNLPSNGIFKAALCEKHYFGNTGCGKNNDRWLTTVSTGNHLLMAVAKNGDGKPTSMLLETGDEE